MSVNISVRMHSRNMAAQPFIIHLRKAAHQQYRPLTISASHTTLYTATPRPRSNYRERRLVLTSPMQSYMNQGFYPDFSALCFYHIRRRSLFKCALWKILGKNKSKL